MIGGEWAFVQRYLCVSTQASAKKVAWLFGALYLTTPLLWMIPPMVFRTIQPNADPEQAYILACQAVLPAGALGLMLAAMRLDRRGSRKVLAPGRASELAAPDNQRIIE